MLKRFAILVLFVGFTPGVIESSPNTIDYEKVFHSFVSKDENINKWTEYEIKHIPKSNYEDALNLLKYYNILDHPVRWAYNVSKDPVAVEYFKARWTSYLNDEMAVGCYRKASNKLVGVSMLNHFRENFPGEPENKSPNFAKYWDFNEHIWFSTSVCVKFDVRKALFGYAIVVHGDYRNRGIELELLKSTSAICQHYEYKVASYIIFPAYINKIAAQLAQKDKRLQVVQSIKFDDIRKANKDKNYLKIDGAVNQWAFDYTSTNF